ncbi:MAG: putative PEP-binding protein [Bacteroidota bacterium]
MAGIITNELEMNSLSYNFHRKALIWSSRCLEEPELIRDKVIILNFDTPLYIAAFVSIHNPLGVILVKSGKNNHLSIYFNDNLIPNRSVSFGLMEIQNSINFLDQSVEDFKKLKYHWNHESNHSSKNIHTDIGLKYLANIGSIEGAELASRFNANGIGIIRSEFVAVRCLGELLFERYEDGSLVFDIINKSNEITAITKIAKDKNLSKKMSYKLETLLLYCLNKFPEDEVVIRSIDLEETPYDHMGFRGVRRSFQEDWPFFRLMINCIVQIIKSDPEKYNSRLGVLIPLVSSYIQIKKAYSLLMESGLEIKSKDNKGHFNINFGWKVEQPSSVINFNYWIENFKLDFGYLPSIIGIGTNDLTQFTLAVDRNLTDYQEPSEKDGNKQLLYNEWDFSIIRQLFVIAKLCSNYGINPYLHGELASVPQFAPIVKLLGLTPSLSSTKLQLFITNISKANDDWQVNGIEKWLEYYSNEHLRHYHKIIRIKMVEELRKILS